MSALPDYKRQLPQIGYGRPQTVEYGDPQQSMGGLLGLAQALEPLAQKRLTRERDKQMMDVFALNPDFGSRYYNTVNQTAQTDILKQESERKRQQMDALRGLAQQIGSNGSREDALLRYAQLTGDLDTYFRDTASPSSIKEYEAVAQMTPEEQQLYFKTKRGPSINDLGGYISVYDPTTGQVVPLANKTLPPEQLPETKKEQASATEVGKREGEARGSLQFNEANLPKLEKVVAELSALGKEATYTSLGAAEDWVQRQLGVDPGEDARARAEYIAKVDNEILPLLRDTFGAAFTVQEGESLRATLGQVNLSPSEKDAVLKAFIEQKKAQIQSLKRQVGAPSGVSSDIGDLQNLSDEKLLEMLQ